MDELQKVQKGSVWGAALLIAGTSIGAGMLALPFVTGVAGFWPSMVVNVCCWLFMLATGLLFLEVTLWRPDGSNILSMSKHYLGRVGWFVGGIAFLFLYYSLLVAYFSGSFTGTTQVVFVVALGAIVLLGAHVTDRVNFILMVGLIVSYLAMLGLSKSEVRFDFLVERRWGVAWLAVPTLFGAYGYHNIIPSVSTYLRREAKKLQWAVVIGTLIPFVIYSIWQWIIIGTVPNDLIQETLDKGGSIAEAVKIVSKSTWFPRTVEFFSFFALTTSILGVSLSFVDFLGDGTHISRKGWGRVVLVLLVFVPPFLLAWTVPGLFFTALRYAGGFGEAALNGLFPVLMVWIGRYKRGEESAYRLPGGRVTLSALLIISVAIIVGEIIRL